MENNKPCNFCNKIVKKDKDGMHQERCRFNPKNKFCEICNKEFKSSWACTSHMSMHKSNWKDICNKITETKHKNYPNGRKLGPCSDVHKEKLRNAAIAVQIRKFGPLTKTLNCKYCKNDFEVKRNVKKTYCPSCVENKRRCPLSKEHREKISRKMTGSTKPPNCGIGRGKKGSYQGIWCDSSWELAWVLYNKELGTNFRRNIKSFEYNFEGRKLKYFPDFVLTDTSGNDRFIEIKGFTDKKFIQKESQLGSMITVLRRAEMQPILDWTIQKYGINFIDQYDDKECRTKIKIKKERKAHVKTISTSYNDFVEAINVAKCPSWGWISRAAKILNVSHTQIGRLEKFYFS